MALQTDCYTTLGDALESPAANNFHFLPERLPLALLIVIYFVRRRYSDFS